MKNLFVLSILFVLYISSFSLSQTSSKTSEACKRVADFIYIVDEDCSSCVCKIFRNNREMDCRENRRNSLCLGDIVKSKKRLSINIYSSYAKIEEKQRDNFNIYKILPITAKERFISITKGILEFFGIDLSKYRTKIVYVASRGSDKVDLKKVLVGFNPKFSVVSSDDTLIFSNGTKNGLYIKFYLVMGKSVEDGLENNVEMGGKNEDKERDFEEIEIASFQIEPNQMRFIRVSSLFEKLDKEDKRRLKNFNRKFYIKWEMINPFLNMVVKKGILIVLPNDMAKELFSNKSDWDNARVLKELCFNWRLKEVLLNRLEKGDLSEEDLKRILNNSGKCFINSFEGEREEETKN